MDLAHLPVELIQHIHVLAHNPFLPHTCRYIYASLHGTSPHYTAAYLLSLYSPYGPSEILVRALRHPVCDIDVALALNEQWEKRRRMGNGKSTVTSLDPMLGKRARSKSGSASPEPAIRPLAVRELPRRLFRVSKPEPPIHPMITYLFETYSPSPNSHKGYPLCRAVLQHNLPLISFLLVHGADPSLKDFMAVEIAISMKDLQMVKMLIERQPGEETKTDSPAKRVKLGDRVTVGTRMVETAIKKGANEIVNYLVHDKKVMPPLQSIMELGKPDAPISKPKSRPKQKSNKRQRQAGFK
ncbi:hypothetical protein I350_02140 [Cryptococcus amylolentus CBS 6273]|uniref:Uncharacterized protein n=1 Tax=Cryptococcus amylolentus CBS 6273 TaxID=1296118 RepID=A0A1E3KBH9_9TREE|nr:hypothetical protein I350_02140 [Cryptococcus amylolentus CBS 6273]